MTIPDWVQDAVFYQIFPDRFARSTRLPDPGFEPWDSAPTVHGFKGGDLYGIAEHLDYLQDLGVTALYLNPVFASASNHRYHTYDYYNVDPLLGGNDALRFLLDQSHRRGMRVILDGVFNHASRGFWQFHHVLENGEASPYKNWFYFDPERLNGRRRWGVYPATGELHALKNGEGSLRALGYQAWWDLPALPKFNTATPAVREFLFDIAEHWTRFGIDGWRLDVPGEINDDSFWQEFRRRVRAVNPEAYIVGEIWHEAGRWLQGDQFDAVMNYLLTAAALSFFGGPRLDMATVNQSGGLQGRVHPGMDANGFANEIDRIFYLYQRDITYAQLNLLDSHDMPRFLSCVPGDKSALRLAWLFLMTYPGAPCIYYGDEIGVDGGHDPDCRKAFPWDASRWDHNLLAYAKDVIALRKRQPALRRGSYQRLYSADGVFAFGRQLEGEALVIALNASDAPRTVEIPVAALSPQARPPEHLFGPQTNAHRRENTLRLEIPARSGVVTKV
ncbi:MAG: glycoside hydrolase family 13 protein [Chloroflexota bacterium]